MPFLSAKDAVTAFVTGDQIVLVQADDDVVLIERSDFITALSGEFGGGSAITLDLGDDGGNDSTDLTEIATSGDTNNIFTMPSADKLLIDVSQNWPTADVADSAIGLRGVGLDATVASPSDGDILVYRTAGSDWVLEAKPAGGGGGGGGGGVDTSGTPVANDFARFTDADTIEGRSYAEVRGDLGLEIGTDVQAYSAVLNATTASFTTTLETKLNGIEAGADVTDTANVTAAGALMDSEVDADIKTLSLPANTTISAFGATLVDDADASAAQTTLGLAIGADVQAYDAVLDATTASFTTALETKLNGIEASADVTDTANVTAAGALMDSEVDADIKTLSLPANTTISTFGASLIDDADASAAQTTLGLVVGTDVQAYNADALFADVSDNLTAGFSSDVEAIGNSGTGTVTLEIADTKENLKTLTVNGSFTLAPQTADSVIAMIVTNDGTGGYTITTSGYDLVSGTYNDTASAVHLFRSTVISGTQILEILEIA